MGDEVERPVVGDMLPEWLEVDRRGGATPLTDCSELIEAFRSSVGVAEREVSRPLDEAPPAARRLSEDGDLLRLKAEGDRSTAGLYVVLGERAGGGGVPAEGEDERDSCLRDCRSSPPSEDLLWLLDILLLSGVVVARWLDDDIVEVKAEL